MSFVMAHDEYDESVQDNMDNLREEFGWHGVAEGLGKVLLSYAILFGGTLLGIGLAIGALYLALAKDRNANDLTHVWVFYIGLGMLSVVGIISYFMLLGGKWRCLIGAPERNHSRWLMFTCMTCIIMGPALNIVVGWTGMEKRPAFKQGVLGFKEIRYSKFGSTMQVASGALGLASQLFFLLFLLATARSFEHKGCINHVNLFLALFVLLIGTTVFLALGHRKLLFTPRVLIALGSAWVIASIWYLVVIAKVRNCIIAGMKSIKSPLDM
jgi:hypothetical protein